MSAVKHRSASPRKHRARKATAAVEFAIFLPLLLTLTFGTIDLCSLLYLKESVTLAAYEGARQGIGRGHTNANCTARLMDFLDERGIDYNTANVVSYSSPGFDSAESLQNVTVTVTVPCAGNLLIASAWFDDLSVSAAVTMRKEYKNLSL